MKKTIILFTAFCTLSSLSVNAQNADEILRKTDEVTYAPKDQIASIKLVLTDKRGNEQIREAEYTQKGTEMRLFRFISPASQRGIAFLSLPGDVMYLYLPAYGKERRIATHVKNQSFAGTDFSYDDMESKPMAEEYDPRYLSETSDAFLLELRPKDADASEYSRMVVAVRKDNYYFQQVDYYDKAGIKYKELMNNKIEKINGYWTATDIIMTDLLKEHTTRMISTGVKFDQGLSDDEFSVRKLKQ